MTPDKFELFSQPKSSKLNVLPANPEIPDPSRVVGLGRFPSWLHRQLPKGAELRQTGKIVSENRLHTVCEEAKCPNLLECWSKKTATFLILGKECTRNCGFCSIDFSKTPQAIDLNEPQRVADSVKQLGLKHVVITMVARDDLPDGGAAHLAAVVKEVRQQNPMSTIEVLTSDFSGNPYAWDLILAAKPDIFNHNIETVRELTPRVRHQATYDRTLSFLSYVKKHLTNSHTLIKSGLMVGLGETQEQVQATIQDLQQAGCAIITIGQYLQPHPQKLRVKAFVTPDQFKQYEQFGLSIGIPYMYCGPFVRSSYNANVVLQKAQESIHIHS
ncbi:lipoyl synthase [Parachlamydia sp. AcF125]|uniref:lipoyl synthase n=1 Tax=Parachlamydia sp. AcF125 TaxID=2795736 RepID=UPI001BC9AD92|nr:lipoyl synthase [Parachlamydia sp. AcF125]MBS4167654.1 Lipoyl synthase [Parachlamydia sp. AcF125]